MWEKLAVDLKTSSSHASDGSCQAQWQGNPLVITGKGNKEYIKQKNMYGHTINYKDIIINKFNIVYFTGDIRVKSLQGAPIK